MHSTVSSCGIASIHLSAGRPRYDTHPRGAGPRGRPSQSSAQCSQPARESEAKFLHVRSPICLREAEHHLAINAYEFALASTISHRWTFLIDIYNTNLNAFETRLYRYVPV